MNTDIKELIEILVICFVRMENVAINGRLSCPPKMFPQIPTNAPLSPANYFGGRTLRDRVAVIG